MSYSYELTKRVNDISLAIISSSLGQFIQPPESAQ